MKLEGAFTALVTPFEKMGGIDTKGLRRIVQQQLEGGIDGLVVAGTTGEAATMTAEEIKCAFEVVRTAADGLVPVILGTGSNSTAATIEATRRAKAFGADAALVVCPYYNKPTQEGLYAHFSAVRDAVELPIIAYNVPGRTASDLLPETIHRLVASGAIVAVKDATANMDVAVRTWAGVDSEHDFSLLTGDDFSILPFLSCGGCGVISVVSNIAPGDTSALVKAVAAGDLQTARVLQSKLTFLSKALFTVSNPIPVKAGMSILGLCEPDTRLPLLTANAGVFETVRAAMDSYGGLLK